MAGRPPRGWRPRGIRTGCDGARGLVRLVREGLMKLYKCFKMCFEGKVILEAWPNVCLQKVGRLLHNDGR